MTYETKNAKYFIKQTDGTKLPISNSEIPKIVEAMSSHSVVVLKSAVINGKYIVSIQRDVEAEHGKIKEGELPLPRSAYKTNLPEILNQIMEGDDLLEIGE